MVNESGRVHVDEKELAARTNANVVLQTENFFPDERYRPSLIKDSKLNRQTAFRVGNHWVRMNSDGIGTKPEMAERLFKETGDYRYFETLAFDGFAMVADDAARNGQFVLGISNNLDVSTANDPRFVTAISKGALNACKAGQFPLLDGETAELGYRVPGFGTDRVNWNFTAMSLTNTDKLIDGSELAPDQTIVLLREPSLRSNGYTRARAIMEHVYFQREGLNSERIDAISELTKRNLTAAKIHEELTNEQIMAVLQHTPMGVDLEQYIQTSWHTMFGKETEQLLAPSTIYNRFMYAAQGGVEGDVEIPILAAANISGGGVPLKGKRMVEGKGMGLSITDSFDDPVIMTKLKELAKEHPKEDDSLLIDERSSYMQWHGGTGFMFVVQNDAVGREAVQLAESEGYEAMIGGKTTDIPVIRYKGYEWEC